MKPIYIEVSAQVRYWEDATINGVDDTQGTLTPFKNSNLWCPIIELTNGKVVDWPLGTIADIYFKVCDAGEYWLLDENKRRIAKWRGFYVPSEFLCHGDNGYGDYIIMKIDSTGYVQKWSQPSISFTCECHHDDEQSSWKKIAED